MRCSVPRTRCISSCSVPLGADVQQYCEATGHWPAQRVCPQTRRFAGLVVGPSPRVVPVFFFLIGSLSSLSSLSFFHTPPLSLFHAHAHKMHTRACPISLWLIGFVSLVFCLLASLRDRHSHLDCCFPGIFFAPLVFSSPIVSLPSIRVSPFPPFVTLRSYHAQVHGA